MPQRTVDSVTIELDGDAFDFGRHTVSLGHVHASQAAPPRQDLPQLCTWSGGGNTAPTPNQPSEKCMLRGVSAYLIRTPEVIRSKD